MAGAWGIWFPSRGKQTRKRVRKIHRRCHICRLTIVDSGLLARFEGRIFLGLRSQGKCLLNPAVRLGEGHTRARNSGDCARRHPATPFAGLRDGEMVAIAVRAAPTVGSHAQEEQDNTDQRGTGPPQAPPRLSSMLFVKIHHKRYMKSQARKQPSPNSIQKT